jgi:hypothetical protein
MPALLSLRVIRFLLTLSFLLIACGSFFRVHAQSGILSTSWHLTGSNSAAEAYQKISSHSLSGKLAITIMYDLHGTCLLPGDASALIFDQNGWKYVSLSRYGKNCFSGKQKVTIPLSAFKDIVSGIALNKSLALTGYFHIRFWNSKPFTVDIMSVTLLKKKAIVSPTPRQMQTSLSPISSPVRATQTSYTQATNSGTWEVQSIDAMKDTKDAVCGQRSPSWIAQWIKKAKELGANYVAISTPYDNPSCGNALLYTKEWVKAIRAAGLHVWHRHMPLAFEGIYNTPKTQSSFLQLMQNYITNNPDIFASGDIFTPIPEPQNGGIYGVTYCAKSVCQFSSAAAFNSWLRSAMTVVSNAFISQNMQNIKIGYFGFDGFIVWGDNNPDWHGILEDTTIKQMGNITIDHYPELVHDTMDNDLTELQTRYPNTPIIIGEWGTVTGGNVVQQVQSDMTAAKRHGVVGFNYWQFGPEGAGEQLIDDNFNNLTQFATVQSFYK